jgi:prolyl 4-hydroxylase
MGDEWCDIVECDEQSESEGITFRPLAGNAIYWENFRADGRGWDELWHWAEKVEGGEKVGLNLWSWFQEGYGNIWREEGDESVLTGGNREEL